MKVQVTNYVFVAATGKVTFLDYTTVRLDSVLMIVNVTSNVLIYAFNDPALGGSVVGNVLTLAYATTGMADSDKLMIYYDDSAAQPAEDATAVGINEAVRLLTRMAKYMDALQVTDQQGRIKVCLDSLSNGPRSGAVTGTMIASNPGANALPVILFEATSQPAISIVSTSTSSTTGVMFALPDVWKYVDSARLNFDQAIRSKLSF